MIARCWLADGVVALSPQPQANPIQFDLVYHIKRKYIRFLYICSNNQCLIQKIYSCLTGIIIYNVYTVIKLAHGTCYSAKPFPDIGFLSFIANCKLLSISSPQFHTQQYSNMDSLRVLKCNFNNQFSYRNCSSSYGIRFHFTLIQSATSPQANQPPNFSWPNHVTSSTASLDQSTLSLLVLQAPTPSRPP